MDHQRHSSTAQVLLLCAVVWCEESQHCSIPHSYDNQMLEM